MGALLCNKKLTGGLGLKQNKYKGLFSIPSLQLRLTQWVAMNDIFNTSENDFIFIFLFLHRINCYYDLEVCDTSSDPLSVCVTEVVRRWQFTGWAVCESIGEGVHSTILSEAWGVGVNRHDMRPYSFMVFDSLEQNQSYPAKWYPNCLWFKISCFLNNTDAALSLVFLHMVFSPIKAWTLDVWDTTTLCIYSTFYQGNNVKKSSVLYILLQMCQTFLF